MIPSAFYELTTQGLSHQTNMGALPLIVGVDLSVSEINLPCSARLVGIG
jgi:hypothetical protein